MPALHEESRRLTGANVYFAQPGAALETARGVSLDDAGITRWRQAITRARTWLGWPAGPLHAHRHATGVTLAFAAPEDQLRSAAMVNEWALHTALGIAGDAAGQPAALHEDEALAALGALAAREAAPALMAVLEAARARGIATTHDDEWLTLGEGVHGRSWPLTALPGRAALEDASLGTIPKAMVTGSNGKTTTVRLLARLLHAHGETVGLSSTDGIVIDGEVVEKGDFSGPMGTRTVLRDRRVTAAVLEVARGGLLRRGLPATGMDVAIVTNVSADHFGEYGVHSIDDLATVKLLVARALRPGGTLVVNAGDAALRRNVQTLDDGHPRAWFARDLDTARAPGTPACGAREGQLWLEAGGHASCLGEIASMPLTMRGQAGYNIENIAAAALAAHLLGVEAATIRAVLRQFGQEHGDNPGRLQHWRFGALDVLLDYAHNPEGLQGLLTLARALHPQGRLGLLLGQAGNRRDEDIAALAGAAAAFNPSRIWLKDVGGEYLRERASGEVARLLRAGLMERGSQEDALPICLDEAAAAREALAWARDGDLLVLPVHESGPRAQVIALLDVLAAGGWQARMPLPA